MMLQGDMMIYAVAALAFIAIVGLGFAFTSGSSESTKKRVKAIGEGAVVTGKGRNSKVMDESAKRRAKNQEMLASLRKKEKERRQVRNPFAMKERLAHAGFSFSPVFFWLGSIVLGTLLAGLIYQSGFEGIEVKGVSIKNRQALTLMVFVVGTFGIPKLLLNMLINRRQSKMVNQFADALDIIVRGIKSGLPLNECIRVIAAESPEPLRKEFVILSDSLAVGAGLDRSLSAFYKRVPLQEVNFFSIVLLIQAKSGGNLSEALGNLSSVIRQRKMMREKVKAMSSEAKASGGIIAALPFVVALMVYLVTPEYIMRLFNTETGNTILFFAACLMSFGIFVMKKMINFKM